MNPLDQENLIGAYASNCTAKVQNKFDIEGSVLKRLMEFSYSVPDFRRSDKWNIRHRHADIIILMILGQASGQVGRAAIIEFGRHN
ncbi:MAG: transposase family protein [Muribaculaceae bacterium]|nr:transposase family protein [Muribaculaceae bacterium]